MKTNLRDLVKQTLSRMNSDSVVNIDDTEESRQIALICRHVYEELEVIRKWGHKTELVEIEENAGERLSLIIPDDVARVFKVQYKITDASGGTCNRDLTYIRPDEWLDKVQCNDSTDDNMQSLFITQSENPGAYFVQFYAPNNKDPEYWTSIDDEYLVFDSYNVDVDTGGIDPDKTIVLGQKLWSFDETDDTQVIEIPSSDWPLYRNMVLSRAYLEIKQTNHPGADAVVRRMMIRAQNSENHRTDRGQRGVNYGR